MRTSQEAIAGGTGLLNVLLTLLMPIAYAPPERPGGSTSGSELTKLLIAYSYFNAFIGLERDALIT
ncbi:hypothetical protein KAR48_19220 [bacterium]|nr:hypothetical protein [bacterium]